MYKNIHPEPAQGKDDHGRNRPRKAKIIHTGMTSPGEVDHGLSEAVDTGVVLAATLA
jgi:hypothetical protein